MTVVDFGFTFANSKKYSNTFD